MVQKWLMWFMRNSASKIWNSYSNPYVTWDINNYYFALIPVTIVCFSTAWWIFANQDYWYFESYSWVISMEAEGTDEDLKLILLNLAATTVCKLQKIKVRTWKQLQLRRPIAIRVLSFKVVAEIEQKCLNFFHRVTVCNTQRQASDFFLVSIEPGPHQHILWHRICFDFSNANRRVISCVKIGRWVS